jgi:hypothetical protein
MAKESTCPVHFNNKACAALLPLPASVKSSKSWGHATIQRLDDDFAIKSALSRWFYDPYQRNETFSPISFLIIGERHEVLNTSLNQIVK